ncbi:HPr kinase/phosphorylase [Sporosarcina sp. BP05]|uniref:HPr kinase/phosphorylase n=1 Tax=Sporosarcina sp. BP05 TaxID=2758726 RepID=UPI0016448453|nr:aldolase [Sporosarcina sp. BP05]
MLSKRDSVYRAFGLTILSEIPLPELPQLSGIGNVTDIVIEQSDLSTLWAKHSDFEEDFVVKRDWLMFHIPETAIYLIQDGHKIVVSPLNGSDEDQIRLFLLGTCMGAVLLQRKILPLHGSAIAIDGKAYAIVGDSGAGKSTLASAFLKRGYQLLSDDVIPVTLNHANVPIVTPAYPQQKLWLESLTHFGMESTDYQPLFVRDTKFAIPVESQFAAEPMPLAGIFELVKGDHQDITIQPIEKMERFYALYAHTYRNFFMQGSGLMEWHFDMSSKMMNKINIHQIRRPTTRFTANELVELILTTLKMEENVYGY